jgi:predicted Zn-dependent protease
MTPKNPDTALVDALMAVFCLGNELALDADVLPVMQLMRKLRPGAAALAVAEAQQMLQIGDHLAARQLLEEAERQLPASALVKVLLAWTLRSQDDKLWQAYLEEARGLPADPQAQEILDVLDKLSRGEPLARQDKEASGQDDPAPNAGGLLPAGYLGVPC